MALIILNNCDGNDSNEAATIVPQAGIAAASIQSLARGNPLPAGPIDRSVMIAALADLPGLAVSDQPVPGQGTQAGTHLIFRSLQNVTMHPSSDGFGMLTFGLQGISKATCASLTNHKPATSRDVIFNKDRSVYFYSPDAANCDAARPTVALRYCAPLLGPCPPPLN